jgi:hypothetical protein
MSFGLEIRVLYLKMRKILDQGLPGRRRTRTAVLYNASYLGRCVPEALRTVSFTRKNSLSRNSLSS